MMMMKGAEDRALPGARKEIRKGGGGSGSSGCSVPDRYDDDGVLFLP